MKRTRSKACLVQRSSFPRRLPGQRSARFHDLRQCLKTVEVYTRELRELQGQEPDTREALTGGGNSDHLVGAVSGFGELGSRASGQVHGGQAGGEDVLEADAVGQSVGDEEDLTDLVDPAATLSETLAAQGGLDIGVLGLHPPAYDDPVGLLTGLGSFDEHESPLAVEEEGTGALLDDLRHVHQSLIMRSRLGRVTRNPRSRGRLERGSLWARSITRVPWKEQRPWSQRVLSRTNPCPRPNLRVITCWSVASRRISMCGITCGAKRTSSSRRSR